MKPPNFEHLHLATRALRPHRNVWRCRIVNGSPRSMLRQICSFSPRASRGTAWPTPRRCRHGLPVIGTTAGAIPDTIPQGAGLLVPPDDPAALAVALRGVIADTEQRRRLSEAALAAARTLPTWQQSAADLRRYAGQARMSGFSVEWLACGKATTCVRAIRRCLPR